MSGSRTASGRCHLACLGAGPLPGDAVWHVWEPNRFRKMPSGMSGSRTASGRCHSACSGAEPLPGDAVRHVREPDRFREMPSGMSGSRTASGRCRLACPGAGPLPGDAVWHVREPDRFREMPSADLASRAKICPSRLVAVPTKTRHGCLPLNIKSFQRNDLPGRPIKKSAVPASSAHPY
jgi:hypothetical protein